MRAKAFDELTAGEVMSGCRVSIPDVMSVRSAARVMAEAGVGAAPVTDAPGRCVGLLLASHVLGWAAEEDGVGPEAGSYWSEWQMAPSGGATEVRRRMTTPPPVVAADAPLREVVPRLLAAGAAVVVDQRHRPVGLLSPSDVLAADTSGPPPEANGRPRGPGPTPGAAPGVRRAGGTLSTRARPDTRGCRQEGRA